MPGFQAEGLVHDPDGRIVKGLHPRNDWIPVSTGGERRRRVVRRGRGQPDRADRLPPDRPRRPAHHLAEPRLHPRARRPVPTRDRGRRARRGPRGRRRAAPHPPRRPAGGRAARRRRARPRRARPQRPRRLPRRHRLHRPHFRRGRRPSRAVRSAGSAVRHRRPHGLRGRPRPHRLRLALAGARDRAEGRPHRRERRPAHGRRRLPGLRDVERPAVGLVGGGATPTCSPG